MVIASLSEQLGLRPHQEMLPESLGAEHLGTVEAASASLAKALRDDTVTIKEINEFLQTNPQFSPNLRDHLLSKKAWLLSREGRLEEALECYDQALTHDEEIPSAWTLKGTALLQLERIDEAFYAFRNAYTHRHLFGPQRQIHLENLLAVWSTSALLRGLLGILKQDIGEAQTGVAEYISLLDLAKEDKLEAMVLNLAVEQPVSEEIKAALEELALMMRLLSIKDPFEGWRELSKEISKVWPKDVSAVDAIREQRDRKWPT